MRTIKQAIELDEDELIGSQKDYKESIEFARLMLKKEGIKAIFSERHILIALWVCGGYHNMFLDIKRFSNICLEAKRLTRCKESYEDFKKKNIWIYCNMFVISLHFLANDVTAAKEAIFEESYEKLKISLGKVGIQFLKYRIESKAKGISKIDGMRWQAMQEAFEEKV